MGRKMIKSLFFISTFIIIVSTACGTTTKAETPTPLPPKASPTLAPTYTPYPTYTPAPTRTRVPTEPPTPTATSIADVPPTQVDATFPDLCQSSKVSGFITCSDDSGNITVDVPDRWKEVNGTSWTYDGENIGVAISAAPSLSDFENNYDSEGLFFGASPTLAQSRGYVEILDAYAAPYQKDCTWVDRYEYNDGVYWGKYDRYTDCGGTKGYDTYLLSAVDIVDQSSKIILVEISIKTEDAYIKDHIWGTFYVYF